MKRCCTATPGRARAWRVEDIRCQAEQLGVTLRSCGKARVRSGLPACLPAAGVVRSFLSFVRHWDKIPEAQQVKTHLPMASEASAHGPLALGF